MSSTASSPRACSGHPLGWEVLGTADTVQAIDAAQVRAFHDRWYRRSNMVIAVVGPVDHDEIVARSIPRSPSSARVSARFGQHRRPRSCLRSSRRVRSSRCISPRDGAPVACTALIGMRAVATQVLGGGWSSRLVPRGSREAGLSYSVFASVGSFADCGTMSVYAATAPERLDELRTVINAQLKTSPPTAQARENSTWHAGGFEGATVLGLEDTGSRMARLATNVLIRDRVVGVDEYLDAVREVTAADVQRVLAEVLEGTAAVSIVGPG